MAALLRLAQFVPEEFGKRIQEALVANGQDVGAIDGVLGPRSRNALDIYIASKDLTPACVGEVATRDCLTKLSGVGFFEGTQGQ